MVIPDLQMRDELRTTLCDLNCFVRSFDSAEAFLQEDRSGGAACLIMELQLPGLSSFELLKRLGENGSRIPSIILTAHGNVRDAVRALRVGAAAFIEKPYTRRALLDEVRFFLG